MSEAFVFTFKDGLLSPLAHDLKLRVTKLEIADKRAVFDASSLRVESAGGPLPKTFYSEIEKNIREDVLRSSKFPQVVFEAAEVGDTEITGKLTLCGVTRDIRLKRHGNVVEYALNQPDFGIKPFTAMLGTLKVKPVVKVQVTL
ncbi:MAG: YceI family protein [Myxococcaceae bacterium]|nr:YceI family protein [Myxococcaceae bacterium]